MTVPPPLDPVLLREHAYYDTKLLNLVLKPDRNPGFLPLHIRGLGSFNYEMNEAFPKAFSFKQFDLSARDPEEDVYAAKPSGGFVWGYVWLAMAVMAVCGAILYIRRARISRPAVKDLEKAWYESKEIASPVPSLVSTPGTHNRLFSTEIETPTSCDFSMDVKEARPMFHYVLPETIV